MISLKKDVFVSPLGIFIIYILLSALVIMGFRFIFPGDAAPLANFSISWRIIRGFLDFLRLFPALALSALVIPFGFKIQAQERNNPFSPQFLKSLFGSIITAIVAAALYGLLFSLALPLAQDYEGNIRYQSRLYTLSKEKAYEYAVLGEWDETAQFITICEGIWPNGKELSELKVEAEVRSEGMRYISRHMLDAKQSGFQPDLGGVQPLDATEALALAETALAEERYFDAHWLATLGGRLARDGSPEKTIANRLAGRAWEGVNSLEPNAAESRSHRIYRLKREGYNALLGEEWIRSYYIFLELKDLSPDDPDVEKYFTLSENGVKQVAFFIDEIERYLTLGKMLTGAIFSLPLNTGPTRPGRIVVRMASLSTFPDNAYSIENEILAFEGDGRPIWSVKAPYAKIIPMTLETGPVVVILLRALDREDETKKWEAEILGLEHNVGGAKIVLPVSWDDFLLLTNIRRGISGLSLADLKKAADNLGSFGYQAQVFEAELLRRFAEPLLVLPLGILAIVVGWRYRAMKRPRYMGIPMLFILPAVMTGIEHFVRLWINNLGIWAVVSLGFVSAAIFFGIGVLVLLILSLITLAAQHG